MGGLEGHVVVKGQEYNLCFVFACRAKQGAEIRTCFLFRMIIFPFWTMFLLIFRIYCLRVLFDSHPRDQSCITRLHILFNIWSTHCKNTAVWPSIFLRIYHVCVYVSCRALVYIIFFLNQGGVRFNISELLFKV